MTFKRKYEQAIRFVVSKSLLREFKGFCWKERIAKRQTKAKKQAEEANKK